MALKIGLIGAPNTGKSYSRRNVDGSKSFALVPSVKLTYLKDSDGKPVKPFNIVDKDGKSILGPAMSNFGRQATTKSGKQSAVVQALATGKLKLPEGAKITGSVAVVDDVSQLKYWMQMVSNLMPHVVNLFLVDFTHYISEVIASPQFKAQKSGGGAYQRFWDLAADALHTFFTREVDSLRDDLIVITEFHTEFNEAEGVNRIFVPMGKMLSEKFKPESYFDIMLHARYIDEEEDPSLDYKSRFVFVTRKDGKYDGRCAGMFDELNIPNDLNPILTRVREEHGI